MFNFWYQFLHRLCAAGYFARITVLNLERLPKAGPVLYLGLHRNGAVDGFIYHTILTGSTFLISTQLRKNWFARLFFDGIAVVRTKDEGDRGVNTGALRECVALLRNGGRLFVFPEGTSSLGPRHLPFKSGAAQLLLDALGGPGSPIKVVPIGIHYECPWGFRSKVEVVVGAPVNTALEATLSPLGRLKELKRRFSAALEDVGVNVCSEQHQEMIQRLAYVATLATARSYFKTLKAFEHAIPEAVLSAWQALEPELDRRRLLRHQGVPLFPMGPVWVYLAAFLVLAPVVLLAWAMNLPPLAAAWWAGRTFPDDRNVISLWRILAGVPAFALWSLAVAVTLVASSHSSWLAGYVVASGLGLWLYYRVKKLAVAVHNGLRHPDLRARVLAFRQTVLAALEEQPGTGGVPAAQLEPVR